jgi:hypothetical protein
MKLQVDEIKIDQIVSWWNGKLMNLQIDDIAGWWNYKAMKLQVDDMTSGWNYKVMKWKVDEITSWWNDYWVKWKVDEMTSGSSGYNAEFMKLTSISTKQFSSVIQNDNDKKLKLHWFMIVWRRAKFSKYQKYQ